MPSMIRAFVTCSWKSVWYLLRCMEMIRNIYFLWDMVFGRYIRNIWGKYVWIVCEECVCKIYGSMREIIWRLNMVNTWAYNSYWSDFLCYVMGYVDF